MSGGELTVRGKNANFVFLSDSDTHAYMQQSWPTKKGEIAKYFSNVLGGWEILFHPRGSNNTTGSDVDWPVVPQVVLDFAARILTATSQHLLSPTVIHLLDRVIALWPNIWIWIQTLHMHFMQRHLSGLSAPPNGEHYTAVLQALRCFTSCDLPLNFIAAVESTAGVAQMMAILWVEEAKDTTSRLGFGASELLYPHPPAPAINTKLLQNIINGAKDGSHGPADLLISRIKRNLKQTHIEQKYLANDLLLFGMKLGKDMSDPASQTLRKEIISHPMVVTMTVDILALVLDAKPSVETAAYDALLILILRTITALCYSMQAHMFVEEILGTTFFTLVAQIVEDFETQTQLKELRKIFDILLSETIPRFTFHRSFLIAMRRNIAIAQKAHRNLGSHLNKVRTHTESVLAILNQYKSSDSVVLSCGEPQCTVSDEEGDFQRCSGCSFVCYCSKACQRRHWQGEHKALCYDMRSSYSGTSSLQLAGPDLRFFIHMLVSDVSRIDNAGWSGWKSVAQDSFLSSTSPGPVRKMIFAIDYSNNVTKRHTTFDFDDPTQARSFSQQAPQLGDLWQSCWRTDKVNWEPPSKDSEMQFIIPAIALLPRGLRDLQTMTVNVHISAISRQSTDSVTIPDTASIRRMQVKLLHYK